MKGNNIGHRVGASSHRLRRCFVLEPIEARCFLSASVLGQQSSQAGSEDTAAAPQIQSVAVQSDQAAQDSSSYAQANNSPTVQGETEGESTVQATQSSNTTATTPAREDDAGAAISSTGNATKLASSVAPSLASQAASSISDGGDSQDSSSAEDSTTPVRTSAVSNHGISSLISSKQASGGATPSSTEAASQPAQTNATIPSRRVNGEVETPATGRAASAVDELATNDSASVAAASVPVRADAAIASEPPPPSPQGSASTVANRVAEVLSEPSKLFSKLLITPLESHTAARLANLIVTESYRIAVANPFTFADAQASLFSTTQIYHFARLGNPMSLLNDSVTNFVNELADSPRHAWLNWRTTRARACLITALVAAVDAAVLLYIRRRSVQAARFGYGTDTLH